MTGSRSDWPTLVALALALVPLLAQAELAAAVAAREDALNGWAAESDGLSMQRTRLTEQLAAAKASPCLPPCPLRCAALRWTSALCAT